MAWTNGFFNSVNGDRLYNADQMSRIFEGLITDGVYEAVGNKLAVEPNSGMTIQIATGRGWFNKRWVNNDSEYMMTLEGADVTLNRYAAICVRVDTSNSVRSAIPFVKYSDFATKPTKPTMIRDEYINEYCLAYVYIKAKTTEITAGDIEDTRQNKELCGWVTGLIDQITPDTLYTQFTALFNEWFSNLQVELDGDVATMLTNALPVSATVTLSASNWVDNIQNVTVMGMNTTKSVIIQANDLTKDDYSAAGIKCIAQGANSLAFSCESVPLTNIQVNVLHMGI